MPGRCWLLVLAVLCVWLLPGCAHSPSPRQEEAQHVPQSAKPYKYHVYFVRKGDTLVSIGERFGVPWQRILEDNPCDPAALKPGQVLLIPLHLSDIPVPLGAPVVEPGAQSHGSDDVLGVPPESLHRGRPSHPYWWPTAGTVSRRFGDPVRGFAEPGIGIAAPAGTEVCAVAAGTVICCVRMKPGPRAGWGNVVVVRHSGGLVSWYGHLGQITVKEWQKVEKGERIGTVGSRGDGGAPELALRFFKNERPVDPTQYLP